MEVFSQEIKEILGRWEVVRLLGEGQYGKVYEIQRIDFGTVYKAALKVITIPKSEEEYKEIRATCKDDEEASNYFRSAVEDFVREFALMAKLKGHTNIVNYEDHWVVPAESGIGWTILIRMELLTSLTDYVTKNRLTRRDVTKLGIDICRALELCQRMNVIHRDIKPANIFVSEMGEYKLGDFGVARMIAHTMSGRTGTDSYMAPEVYYESTYGPSADIYSLGIVMYRLLNYNRAPFLPPYPQQVSYRDNAEAFRRRINGEKLPLPAQADGRLAEIVLKACAYQTENRFSSPEAMRKELESILYEENEAEIIYPEGDVVSASDGLTSDGTVSIKDIQKQKEPENYGEETLHLSYKAMSTEAEIFPDTGKDEDTKKEQPINNEEFHTEQTASVRETEKEKKKELYQESKEVKKRSWKEIWRKHKILLILTLIIIAFALFIGEVAFAVVALAVVGIYIMIRDRR